MRFFPMCFFPVRFFPVTINKASAMMSVLTQHISTVLVKRCAPKSSTGFSSRWHYALLMHGDTKTTLELNQG